MSRSFQEAGIQAGDQKGSDVIQPNVSAQHLTNCFALASASHLFLDTRLSNNCVISLLCDGSGDTVESIRLLPKRIGLSRPEQT